MFGRKKLTVEEQLKKENFNIGKYLKLGLHSHFFVDDINKKFAVGVGGKTGQVKIYNYNDLGEFELNEDGNSIVKGKGLATAVGGLTFGVLGAMIGASGKRKNQNNCTSLVVRIRVNDLNNPEVMIPFITTETKKDNSLYKYALSEANNLIATLNYIEKQE